MKYADLHCDTPTRLVMYNVSLKESHLHVSEKRFSQYEKYVQLAAIFTDKKLGNDDGYRKFWEVRENLIKECDALDIPIVKTSSELTKALDEKNRAFVLTVEDARLLNGDISRVRELYDAGVRVMTLLWGGETVIGGSHDSPLGLTEFGSEAVHEMIKLGMIPDISHASFRSTDDILDICEKEHAVPIATHMNSYTVCPHTRNLTDDRYLRLTKLGGIAGISLCKYHLTNDPNHCSMDHIASHVKHYQDLAPGKVAFGCDFDGTTAPNGVQNISHMPRIKSRLEKKGMSESEISAVYYDTVVNFLKDNLPVK